MCLGIPGQVADVIDRDFARVEVNGVGRVVNVGLLVDEPVHRGDWVLIHVGFALSKIDEDEARLALDTLQAMGQAYADELAALAASNAHADGSAG